MPYTALCHSSSALPSPDFPCPTLKASGASLRKRWEIGVISMPNLDGNPPLLHPTPKTSAEASKGLPSHQNDESVCVRERKRTGKSVCAYQSCQVSVSRVCECVHGWRAKTDKVEVALWLNKESRPSRKWSTTVSNSMEERWIREVTFRLSMLFNIKVPETITTRWHDNAEHI